MLVRLKALVSTILLSTAAFGLCNYAPGYFGPTDEAPDRFEASAALTKGFDVSPAQPNINWNSVVSQNYAYVYIRATEGSSKRDDNLVVQSADILFQRTKALNSPLSTLAQPMLISSAADITLPFPITPLVQLRPSGLFPTEEAGLVMALLSRARSICKVRVVYPQPPGPPN